MSESYTSRSLSQIAPSDWELDQSKCTVFIGSYVTFSFT